MSDRTCRDCVLRGRDNEPDWIEFCFRHEVLLALVDGMAALLRSAEFRGDLAKIEDCAVALRAYDDIQGRRES